MTRHPFDRASPVIVTPPRALHLGRYSHRARPPPAPPVTHTLLFAWLFLTGEAPTAWLRPLDIDETSPSGPAEQEKTPRASIARS